MKGDHLQWNWQDFACVCSKCIAGNLNKMVTPPPPLKKQQHKNTLTHSLFFHLLQGVSKFIYIYCKLSSLSDVMPFFKQVAWVSWSDNMYVPYSYRHTFAHTNRDQLYFCLRISFLCFLCTHIYIIDIKSKLFLSYSHISVFVCICVCAWVYVHD